MELSEVIDTLEKSLNKKFILKWSITRHPVIKANMVHKISLYELIGTSPKLIIDFRRDYLKDKIVEESKNSDMEFLKLMFDEYTCKQISDSSK